MAAASSRSKATRETSPSAFTANGAPKDVQVSGTQLSKLVDVNGGAPGPRSKRSAIIDTAVARFGDTGYELTKWSTIADEVGIGQTALYHYFESKAHCLLTIMRLELARSYQRFLTAVHEHAVHSEAIEHALIATFDVTTAEVSQLRILMAHGDLLANPRPSEREESERKICLELTRLIEQAWTDLLGRKLTAERDQRDPRMLARAVLGLINSVWRWYRLGGRLELKDVSSFYVESALLIVG
jgi:AcrR family transcriptional regulator